MLRREYSDTLIQWAFSSGVKPASLAIFYDGLECEAQYPRHLLIFKLRVLFNEVKTAALKQALTTNPDYQTFLDWRARLNSQFKHVPIYYLQKFDTKDGSWRLANSLFGQNAYAT